MQGGYDHRDPPITRELRRETLRKLVTDLLLSANPNDEGLMSRLRLSATRFENEMFTTAATKEEYERVMGMRPVTSITTGGNYIGPNVAAMRARWEALSQRRVFRGQQDDSRSSPASSAASGPQTQLPSFSRRPLPSPGHHQAGPSLISFSNQTYPRPPQPQPHPGLIQQQPVPSYQQASNRAAAQSSLPNQQLVETKAIAQESQNPVGPGSSREQPITVAEDNADWHDTAYTDLQKCREECLLVSQFIRHNISRSPQQPIAKFVKVMKFMNMERRDLAAAQISKATFDSQVNIIYKLKEDLVARQRWLVSQRQNQPQPPGGPRGAQPVADESQRINEQPNQDAGRPTKALQDSTERDILALLSFTNGWKEADIDAMVAWNFYCIDDLIDSGCHTLHKAGRPAKRRRSVVQQ